MKILVDIHPDWSPGAVAELVARLRAFEQPPSMLATASPQNAPIREPAAADDDLSVLLGGMEDEPAPATAATPDLASTDARSPYVPPLATPATRRPTPTPTYDGVPTTGQGLYRWACNRKVLPKINAIGKGHSWPRLVTHWEPEMVATALAEIEAAQPGAYAPAATNGRR